MMPYRNSTGSKRFWCDPKVLFRFLIVLEDDQDIILNILATYSEICKFEITCIIEAVYADKKYVEFFLEGILAFGKEFEGFCKRLEKAVEFSKTTDVEQRAWIEMLEEILPGNKRG